MKNGFRAKELQRKLKWPTRFLLVYSKYGMHFSRQINWRDKLDNRIKYNIKSDFENFIKKGTKW